MYKAGQFQNLFHVAQIMMVNSIYSETNKREPEIQDSNSVKKPITASIQTIIKMSGHQYQWLAGDNDLEIGHF